jgi:hypothetical protein
MKIPNVENIEPYINQLYDLPEKTLMVIYRAGCFDPNIDYADPVVKAIIEAKLLARIENATTELGQATEKSVQEVIRLADSSDKMEVLTSKLKKFTIWLLVFAGAQIIIAGVQTWRMFQPDKPIQVVVQPLPHSAPQTPTLPPR